MKPKTEFSYKDSILNLYKPTTTKNMITNKTPKRIIAKEPIRILDAPYLDNDFYSNPMSWGNHGVLAIGLADEAYIWN